MAEEQEPQSTEELQEAEDPEETPGYVAPAKKSLDEIKNLDADDESLVRYKQQLLGAAGDGAKGDGPHMEPLKMTLIVTSEERPEETVDLTNLEELKKKPKKFVMKEGIEYKVKFTFRINNEILCGLRYNQVITRKGINVGKESFMMGSYGPKAEEQEFTTPEPQEVPKGIMYRGSYNIKSKFVDDDKNVHGEWTWTLDVKKDWE